MINSISILSIMVENSLIHNLTDVRAAENIEQQVAAECRDPIAVNLAA